MNEHILLAMSRAPIYEQRQLLSCEKRRRRSGGIQMSNKLAKKKGSGEKPTLLANLYQDNGHMLDFLTCIFMMVVIVGIPLYNKSSYSKIGTDKREFFTSFLKYFDRFLLIFLLIQLILHIIQMVKTSKLNLPSLKNYSVTDLCVAGYFLSVLISYLFSDYRETAVIGSANWSMGALMQLSLAGGYFLISRFWKNRLWIPLLMLPVSAILFALGYLNRFGIWPIHMDASENPQFISLAGNINWYCGYMVTILFGAVYLAWSDAFSKRWQKNLLNVYLFIGFAALVTNGSSSGILTLLGIFFVLLLLSVSDGHKTERYCEIALILGLSCLVTLGIRLLFPDAITYQETTNNLLTYTPLPIILTLLALAVYIWIHRYCQKGTYPVKHFRRLATGLAVFCLAALLIFVILLIMNTINPGSIGFLSDYSFFTFSEEWGSRRGATWKAGVLAWLELSFPRKLIGVGPDCMGEFFYQDAGDTLLDMLNRLWPSSHLSNAHNEWLTILVNLGIFGFISFACMIISAVYYFLKKGANQDQPYHSLIGACGLAILAYSIHNIVSFQQILNEPAMFVILGIGAAYSRSPRSTAD